jgi:RNA polymerase sigma factor (sigma-70 family)
VIGGESADSERVDLRPVEVARTLNCQPGQADPHGRGATSTDFRIRPGQIRTHTARVHRTRHERHRTPHTPHNNQEATHHKGIAGHVVTSPTTGNDAHVPDPSFDEVFCELLHRLYRRAAMLSGSRQSADDAVHEVYLKLAARPEKFLAHPEPYAYAFSSLLSVLRDSWRRERRQVLVADVEFTAEGGGDARAPGTAPSGAAAQWDDGGLEQRTSELETVRLLRQLTVRQAGVVVLVDLDGYTIDQAAKILGLHRGTVALTRRRALDKLRRTLHQRTDRPGPSDHPGRSGRRDRSDRSGRRSDQSGGEPHAC